MELPQHDDRGILAPILDIQYLFVSSLHGVSLKTLNVTSVPSTDEKGGQHSNNEHQASSPGSLYGGTGGRSHFI